MLRIALIRHGQTVWNTERRFLGRTDLPLNEEGERQAADLGIRYKGQFQAVYCSPLLRAKATSEALGVPVLVPMLAEMDQGELEGKTRAEAMLEYPGFFEQWLTDMANTPTPGGEHVAVVADRAMSALEWICSRHIEQVSTIAVVSHQIVIGAITCRILEEPLQRWGSFGLPNTGVRWLEWDGKFRVMEG